MVLQLPPTEGAGGAWSWRERCFTAQLNVCSLTCSTKLSAFETIMFLLVILLMAAFSTPTVMRVLSGRRNASNIFVW